MTIYTRKGDQGETGLPGKRRLSKTDRLFEVLGSLDQASATIGLAVSFISNDKKLITQLENSQRNFLAIGACLASEEPASAKILEQLPGEILLLEQQIDSWEAKLPELKNFILAGGDQGGATLHLARTVIRQAERNYHRLDPSANFPAISQYLNRLSDYLFQAARYHNFLAKKQETIWQTEH